MNFDEVVEVAKDVRRCAYAPYSNYYVGAALVTKSGKIFSGCNIENNGIMSICAERVAFVKALSEGERDFDYMVICGGSNLNSFADCTPCGYCRQFIHEFVNENFKIFLINSKDETEVYNINNLLPHSFKL